MSLDVVLWLAVLVTGLVVSVYSARWAVEHVVEFASGTRIPPFVIGITLVSIGTDLPEIANSIVASVTGHGDINVGDSVGSAMVQATLVLGLLPLIAGAFPIARGRVARIGGATVVALLAGGVLMLDGDLSRFDAIVLLILWVAGTVLIWRDLPPDTAPFVKSRSPANLRHLLFAAIGLIFVALGATTAIQALTRLAELWSMPEFIVAFLLASVGTSLPELTVEYAAVKKKQWDLAVGDAFGSSFVDSTMSLGIGPLIAPVTVSASLVVGGAVVAAIAVGLAAFILAQRQRHNWASGLVLIGLFVIGYAAIVLIS